MNNPKCALGSLMECSEKLGGKLLGDMYCMRHYEEVIKDMMRDDALRRAGKGEV